MSRLLFVRVFTDLNLNHDVPARIQPEIGEWGPASVVSTRQKKRARWLWPAGFVVAASGIFIFGHWIFDLIMSSGG